MSSHDQPVSSATDVRNQSGDSDRPPPSDPHAQQPDLLNVATLPGSRLTFVIGIVIVGAGLSIAAAHAPARIRLLGLFSLGFGLLVGWLASQLAQRLRSPVGPVDLVVIGIVTFASLIASTWQTFRLEPEPKTETPQHPIVVAVMNEMRKKEGMSLEDLPEPTLMTPRPIDRFRQYLARRIQTLGEWSSPWPEVFWGCEALIGTAGAIWIARRPRRQESAT